MSNEIATTGDPNAKSQEIMRSLKSGGRVAPIVPRDVEEAFRIAKAVINAGLAPASYEKDGPSRDPDVQKVLIGILKGAEVGLPPITALSTIAIINRRPCIWGDGAVALVQESGQVAKVEQRFEGADGEDDWTAIYRIWRRGQDEPYEGRFSVKDAKRAHLWMNPKKQPWIQYPQRMLMARARAYALRDGFADCLMGLSIAEEVQDIPAPPQEVDKSFLDDEPAVSDAPQVTDQSGDDTVNALIDEGDRAETAARDHADEDVFPGDLPFKEREPA